MLYNIYFEVASIPFILVMILFHYAKYNANTIMNRRFRVLALWSLAFIVLDSLTAITISYYTYLPLWLNIVLNTANFMVVSYDSFYFTIYVQTVISDDYKPFLPNKIAIIIFEITWLLNMKEGFYFYFSKQGYVHGPLYLLHLAVLYYYVFYTMFILVKNHKLIDCTKLISTFSYVLAFIVCAFIQVAINPRILIMGFGIALVLFIIFFSLETPDYLRLSKTMEELDAAREEAVHANQAKSIFLSQMSHEIRTPINAIMGMNEMICRESTDQQILEYANAVSDSAKSLLTIVNDILDFSKIEAGKMEIVQYEYEVASLLMDAYNMTITRAEDKGLTMEVICDDTIPVTLKGDMVRIRQIILNLLTNAIKYTDQGTVTLELRGKRIGATLQLTIRVEDTGIGMTEESLEKLFGKFQRFDMKRNQNVEGTGLGLAITKQLVELMHGDIRVESVYGEGSCFTVNLPQIISSQTPIGDYRIRYHQLNKNSIRENITFTAQTAKILVVDDVKMNLVVFKNLIKDTKITIDTCLSGQECLELLQQQGYDMIFMDHMMPGLDGIETFQKIKQLPDGRNRNTPVIMLTANAITGMEENYLSLGFYGYLSKPIDDAKLRKLLLKHIPDNKIEMENKEMNLKALFQKKNPSKPANDTPVSKAISSGTDTENAIIDTPDTVDSVSTDNVSVSTETAGLDSLATVDFPSDTEGILAELTKTFPEMNLDMGINFCGGSKDFYLEILGDFVHDLKYQEMLDDYEQKDWKNYAIIVHGIKGSARMLGFSDLGDMAETLQFAAEKEEADTILSEHGKMLDKLNQVMDFVKKCDAAS